MSLEIGAETTFLLDMVNFQYGPELLTSITNGVTYPYETLTEDNVDVSSAINSSSFGGFTTNHFGLITGNSATVFKVEFNFTLNSGTLPKVILTDTDSGAGVKYNAGDFTAAAGANEMIMTSNNVDDKFLSLEVSVGDGVATNFAMTGLSIKKQT